MFVLARQNMVANHVQSREPLRFPYLPCRNGNPARFEKYKYSIPMLTHLGGFEPQYHPAFGLLDGEIHIFPPQDP